MTIMKTALYRLLYVMSGLLRSDKFFLRCLYTASVVCRSYEKCREVFVKKFLTEQSHFVG